MHGISWNLIPQICDFDRLEVVVQSVVWVLAVAYYYFCVLCFVYSISAFIKQDKGPQILNLSRDRGGETHCSWCFYYHLTHIKWFLVLYVNIWCVFSVGGRSIKHLSFICRRTTKAWRATKPGRGGGRGERPVKTGPGVTSRGFLLRPTGSDWMAGTGDEITIHTIAKVQLIDINKRWLTLLADLPMTRLSLWILISSGRRCLETLNGIKNIYIY